jgi:hypothetical protein
LTNNWSLKSCTLGEPSSCDAMDAADDSNTKRRNASRHRHGRMLAKNVARPGSAKCPPGPAFLISSSTVSLSSRSHVSSRTEPILIAPLRQNSCLASCEMKMASAILFRSCSPLRRAAGRP